MSIRKQNPLSPSTFAEIRQLLSRVPRELSPDSIMDFFALQDAVMKLQAEEPNDIERGYIQAHLEDIGISYSDMIEGKYIRLRSLFGAGFAKPFYSSRREAEYLEAGEYLRSIAPLSPFEERFVGYFLNLLGNVSLEEMLVDYTPSARTKSLQAMMEENQIPRAAYEFLRFLHVNHQIEYFYGMGEREALRIPEVREMMEGLEASYQEHRPSAFPDTWQQKVRSQSLLELRFDNGFRSFDPNAYNDHYQRPAPVNFWTVGLYFTHVPELDLEYEFDYADFSGAELVNEWFIAEGVSLQNATFGEVISSTLALKDADLRDANLSGIRNSDVNVMDADLRGAILPESGRGNTFHYSEDTQLPDGFSPEDDPGWVLGESSEW